MTVEESISCSIRGLDTDVTVRGGSAMSRRMHGGEVLARSSCARLARVLFVLVVSIAMFRLGCLYSELRLRSSMTKRLLRSIADEEKKKKHSYEYFFSFKIKSL